MIDSNKRWKFLSFALIGIIAVWAIATVAPQANAATTSASTDITKSVAEIVKDLQALMTQSSSISSATTATKNAVSDPEHGLPAVQSQLDDIQSTLADHEIAFVDSFVITERDCETCDHITVERQIPETDGKTFEITVSATCFYSAPSDEGGTMTIGVNNGEFYFKEGGVFDIPDDQVKGTMKAVGFDNLGEEFPSRTYEVHCFPAFGNDNTQATKLIVNAYGHTTK